MRGGSTPPSAIAITGWAPTRPVVCTTRNTSMASDSFGTHAVKSGGRQYSRVRFSLGPMATVFIVLFRLVLSNELFAGMNTWRTAGFFQWNRGMARPVPGDGWSPASVCLFRARPAKPGVHFQKIGAQCRRGLVAPAHVVFADFQNDGVQPEQLRRVNAFGQRCG